jgi:hypothetical protein
MAQKKAPKAPTAAPEAEKEEKKIAPEVKKPEVKKAPVVEKPVVISEKTVMEEELPDYAKRVLKLYPDVPEMYISRKGRRVLQGHRTFSPWNGYSFQESVLQQILKQYKQWHLVVYL